AANLSVGGNGGLAAYILGRLGQPARLHTRLGRDFWGGWLRARLEAAGVELASDSTDEESSTNIVATDGGGNRLSFFHPLEARYAVAAPLPDTRVMFLGGCPHPTAELMASYFQPYRNAGATTVMDIGPAIPRPFRFDDLARLADAKSVAVAVAFANQIARDVLRATDRLNVDLTASSIHETAVADQVRLMEV